MVSEIYKIKLGDFDIKHCNKVLKAKDYISVVDRLDILSSTKSECSKILRKANEDRDVVERTMVGNDVSVVIPSFFFFFFMPGIPPCHPFFRRNKIERL